ncbi:DUF7093 family protein [Haloplanus ruber]|uniref:Oxidoreductase n=1 Tax=Haloplanus ruber TaxID=869892 RepID=A0ABD6CU80_9EURY|nr:hypothetical protein [Haloplanus ruber]
MGLRCLLGHEYANREVEREREERGDEVVVTYRTVETCDRCGERRIVSENKEVRPVREPTEDGVTTGLGGGVTPDLDAADGAETDHGMPAGEGTPADDGGAPASGGGPTADADQPTADAEATTADQPTADADQPTADAEATAADAEATTADEATVDADQPTAAEEDDAIILDDDTDDDGGVSADRTPGEWPDADDTAVAADGDEGTTGVPEADDGATVVEGEGWPDPEGEDEGFDATPGDAAPEDATIDEEVGPAVGDPAATNGTTEAAGGAAAGKQFVAAQEVEPVGDNRTTAAETEFFCPNCGHARGAGGSSMRAGDICPECHQGYIAERER